jgi:hypothetical protein
VALSVRFATTPSVSVLASSERRLELPLKFEMRGLTKPLGCGVPPP